MNDSMQALGFAAELQTDCSKTGTLNQRVRERERERDRQQSVTGKAEPLFKGRFAAPYKASLEGSWAVTGAVVRRVTITYIPKLGGL